MKQPYLNMTGEKLMRSIRRAEIFRIILNGLIIVFFILFFGSLAKELFSNLSKYWFFLFTTPAWIVAFYVPVKAIKRHSDAAANGEVNEVFRKYGAPDEIAEVLADPENVHLLRTTNIIITKDYLLRRGDFLTYLPLREIAGITVSRTHGKHAHVVMTVQPKNGASVRYSVSLPLTLATLDKQAAMLADDLRDHMALYAPDCRIQTSLW